MPPWFKLFNELPQLMDIKRLIELGGPALVVLALLAFVLWSLLLNKLWFIWQHYPSYKKRCLNASNEIDFLLQRQLASHVMVRSLSLIRIMIKICPLLGLLGTVLGMIEIFDVIAVTDQVNPKQLASGVAKAILPTMAAMVVAISAMLCFGYLQRWSVKQRRALAALNTQFAKGEN